MATARFETIMCFAKHRAVIRIECGSCRHALTVQPRQVADGFGWTTPIREVEKRLVCSACGRKTARLKPLPARR